jgi:hypothetical protein
LEGADPDERRGAYLSWCPELSCDGVDMDNLDRKRGAYLSWCPKSSCNGVGLLVQEKGEGRDKGRTGGGGNESRGVDALHE